jgi:hypothetical protein
MTSYIFIFFAAYFNALMDCFENTPNFNESIFKSADKKFWCKDVSWQYAKKIGGYKLDGWHFAKTFMVICICAGIAFFKPTHQLWVHFVSFGAIWNFTFVLFYHWIFKVK